MNLVFSYNLCFLSLAVCWCLSATGAPAGHGGPECVALGSSGGSQKYNLQQLIITNNHSLIHELINNCCDVRCCDCAWKCFSRENTRAATDDNTTCLSWSFWAPVGLELHKFVTVFVETTALTSSLQTVTIRSSLTFCARFTTSVQLRRSHVSGAYCPLSKVKCLCLLAKYIVHYWSGFNETFTM